MLLTIIFRGKSLKKYFDGLDNETLQGQGINLGIHLAVLKELPKIIESSIDCEEHPDYKKVNNERKPENGVNSDGLLIHRFYGAIELDGKIYRVKTTMKEYQDSNRNNIAYNYEVTKIEVVDDNSTTTSTGPRGFTPNREQSLTITKLLKGVEKSYDPGKKLLDESERIDSLNGSTQFRAGGNAKIAGEFLTADGGVQFRIRIAAPPKKTRIGYKVFVLKNGKLYPPMVANEDREATPVGVWLDADANEHLIIGGKENIDAEYGYVEPWLRRYKVKSGGKGTQGGSGELAYRPGWHLGEIPMALQFDRENLDKPVLDEDGNSVFDKKGKQKYVKDLFPANFVWAEVECAADEDYQQESDERMWYNKYGKRLKNALHSMGGLNHVPENGLYMYRTNPDPNTDAWIITGAMKVNRILKPSEVDQMIRDAGRIPQERQKGAVTDADVEELSKKLGLTSGGTTSFRVVGPGISTSEMAMAQAIYEARVATSGFQVKEALQDSMLGLRACYDAIEKSLGRKREVWEVCHSCRSVTYHINLYRFGSLWACCYVWKLRLSNLRGWFLGLPG